MKTTLHPNGIAPIPEGYRNNGAKGGKVAQAWQHVWDRLSRTEYRDGVQLAEEAARALDIQAASVRAVIHRAAQAGLLAAEKGHTGLTRHRGTSTHPVKQARTFYRIEATKAPIPPATFQAPQ